MKWVYKIKYGPKGHIDIFKAQLVSKGYKQKPNIDYFEFYAPVARINGRCDSFLDAQN